MLIIKGTVVKRTRRVINFGGNKPLLSADEQYRQILNGINQPTQEPSAKPTSFSKVTYQIVGEDHLLYYVTDVEPEKPLAKNEVVEIPVQIKVFVTKKGIPNYELSVVGGDDGLSEEF